jgi:hypothetical protein
MDSLKKYLERLAPLMGTSPAALYERQRQLVRLKLLTAPEKTGPGGGIRATPGNVAMLLLACLVTDNLSEVSAKIGKIARTTANEGRCRLTQATNFISALTRILSDPAIADSVTSVVLDRATGVASISFIKHNVIQPQCTFGRPKERLSFGVEAFLGGPLLRTIVEDLQEEE